MQASAAVDLARTGRLYPGVILHGGSTEARRQMALELGSTLLCAEAEEHRPCGSCRHCRRVAWPEKGQSQFHPDLHVLERDLRTTTSANATKSFLKQGYAAPFEARGQVFVIAEADTLSGEAADSLLKLLEEPPERTPRHFFLLASTQLDLLPTLRSRSLSLFLGPSESLDSEEVDQLTVGFEIALDAHAQSGAAIYLLTAADALAGASGWEDPRARRPWATAAAAVVRAAKGNSSSDRRRRLLALAQELLDGPRLRLRGITHARILDGLLSRHLASSKG